MEANVVDKVGRFILKSIRMERRKIPINMIVIVASNQLPTNEFRLEACLVCSALHDPKSPSPFWPLTKRKETRKEGETEGYDAAMIPLIHTATSVRNK